MRLADAARAFNDAPCRDAYSGAYLFGAQFTLYDDVRRDSETAERRVISVAPNVQIPPRRTIETCGTRFIVGHGSPDFFRGKTLRVGYVAHEATHLATLRTLGEVCSGAAGVTAWAGRAWVKDASYSEQDSRLTPQHHLYFAHGEPAAPRRLIDFDDTLCVVRAVNKGAAGTLVAFCDELEAPVREAATVHLAAYDAATDTTTYTATPAAVLRLRWQSLFAYMAGVAPKFEPGDMQIAIDAAAGTVVPGTRVALPDGFWQVQSATLVDGAWLCRATRAAAP